MNHLTHYTDPGALSIVSRLGAFEAVLGILLISGNPLMPDECP